METVSKIVHSFDLLYKETIKKAMYIFVQNLLFSHGILQIFFGKKHKKGKCLKKACRYIFRNGKKGKRSCRKPWLPLATAQLKLHLLQQSPSMH